MPCARRAPNTRLRCLSAFDDRRRKMYQEEELAVLKEDVRNLMGALHQCKTELRFLLNGRIGMDRRDFLNSLVEIAERALHNAEKNRP